MLHANDAWDMRREDARRADPGRRGDACRPRSASSTLLAPSADRAGAVAPGGGDPGAHHRGRACRAAVASFELAGAARRRKGSAGMIEVTTSDGIAVMTLQHGKANALDIEFCDAIAARFQELAASDAKGDCADRAGQDLLRRRRSHAAERRRRRLYPQIPARAAQALRRGVLSSQAGGGRDQRPRHCRRLRARGLRRPPHHGARSWPHRRHRTAGRRAVSGAGVRDRAFRGAAALSGGSHASAARPTTPTARSSAA